MPLEEPVVELIRIIPSTLVSLTELLKNISDERNGRRRSQKYYEGETIVAKLQEAVIAYAEAHFELKDWKTLHDELTTILDALLAPKYALDAPPSTRVANFETFKAQWYKAGILVGELCSKDFPYLPRRWAFETPRGSQAFDWRHELRLHSNSVHAAPTLATAKVPFLELERLTQLLLLRSNAQLIALAGKLADVSAELKGALSIIRATGLRNG